MRAEFVGLIVEVRGRGGCVAGVGFRAVVVDVRQEGRGRWQLLLDRTEFRAGGRGRVEATARSGVRLVVPVLAVVVEAGGAVWHVVEKPLGVGTVIAAVVDGGADWPRADAGGGAG